MSETFQLTEQEQITAVVYGDTFALYDEQSFNEFITPFYDRLRANNIGTEVFSGKRCLDAGCGGGRGSILMAQCGAREVIGVDLSAKNVETCRKRVEKMHLGNVSFVQHSLMQLPFEDESFDVVWCNGVLHHTTNPDLGLQEITRVLKTHGNLWLYLYGSGGIYWYMVDWVRATLQGVDIHGCICRLRLMDMPIRRIAEWIDDWFAAYVRRYTIHDVTSRLNELGYDDTQVLRYGTGYDTSQRQVGATTVEKALMGEGDLRYFCRKVNAQQGDVFALPDPPDKKGSPYQDTSEVTQFQPALEQITQDLHTLEANLGHNIDFYKIVVCRSVHNQVRSLLETDVPFDTRILYEHLANISMLLKQLQDAAPKQPA